MAQTLLIAEIDAFLNPYVRRPLHSRFEHNQIIPGNKINSL